MKESAEEAKQARRERAKLALIPLLVLVLAGVIFWPQSSSQQNSRVPQLNATAASQIGSSGGEAPTDGKQDPKWPEVDLSAVIAVNPFAKSVAIRKMLGELPAVEPTPPENSERIGASEEAALNALAEEAAEPPAVTQAVEPEPVRDVIDVTTIAKLQAIMETDRGRSALISSKVVREGDRLNEDYRVVEITPTAVYVEWIERIENGEGQ